MKLVSLLVFFLVANAIFTMKIRTKQLVLSGNITNPNITVTGNETGVVTNETGAGNETGGAGNETQPPEGPPGQNITSPGAAIGGNVTSPNETIPEGPPGENITAPTVEEPLVGAPGQPSNITTLFNCAKGINLHENDVMPDDFFYPPNFWCAAWWCNAIPPTFWFDFNGSSVGDSYFILRDWNGSLLSCQDGKLSISQNQSSSWSKGQIPSSSKFTAIRSVNDSAIIVSLDGSVVQYDNSGKVVCAPAPAPLPPVLAGENVINETAGNETAGNETGGNQTGGNETGGNQTGGNETGGNQTGGNETGGNQTGGNETGGNQTGGNETGGNETALEATWKIVKTGRGYDGCGTGLNTVKTPLYIVLQTANGNYLSVGPDGSVSANATSVTDAEHFFGRYNFMERELINILDFQ